MPGRYPATFEEVRAVWGFNGHRRKLLAELRQFVIAVQRMVPVAAVWVSGSYFTGKESPSDMDVTFLIDADDIDRLPARQRPILTAQGLHHLAATLNLRIDAYIIPWVATDNTAHNNQTAVDGYHRTRGQWDDWWLRLRGGDPRDEAMPRRGYVEVMIDGY